ncbi:hypothetical protein TIFTF001_028307 [Ficus carica]|uniref:Zinc finger PMZ-type domain-containing protein n=1 Tax=Ficus carica TaxID=3494 RepID=A0AA88IZZ3_FICCA|nr:hypothetical protein TIFTF001_028307 [Ficus carica]
MMLKKILSKLFIRNVDDVENEGFTVEDHTGVVIGDVDVEKAPADYEIEENTYFTSKKELYKGQNLWKIRNTILVTLAHPSSSTVTTVKLLVRWLSKLKFHKYRATNTNKMEFTIDLSGRTCSCRAWQVDEFPCIYSCAVISKINLPVHNYAEWEVPADLRQTKVLPPTNPRSAGSPINHWFPSAGECSKCNGCGRCYGLGHNRRKCTNPIDPNTVRRGCKKQKAIAPEYH